MSLSVLSWNQRWILPAVKAAVLLIFGTAPLIDKIDNEWNKNRTRWFFTINFRLVTYEFQSGGGTIKAVSTSAGVVFSISRIVLDPRWHETGSQVAAVDTSGVRRSWEMKACYSTVILSFYVFQIYYLSFVYYSLF